VIQAGRQRKIFSRFKEEDPDWWDEKVPDGTSLSGPNGLDSTKFPALNRKGDQPGDFYEFSQNAIKNSHQYKQIAEKFNLSPQHPGLAVSTDLQHLHHLLPDAVGKSFAFNSYHHLGPRFWDKPLNEGCFTKGMCMVKYAAIFTMPYIYFENKAFNIIPHETITFGAIFKRYLKILPLPSTLAFTWGVTMCTAASIRNQDDIYNHFIAGPAVGATFATIKHNIPLAIGMSAIITILGVFYHYQRVSEEGTQFKIPQQQTAGINGPLSWKLFEWGHKEAPKDLY
jgi:hypothetical protein